METPSVGLYPSREGLWSFYPWIPAHFQTWKLHPLAMDKNSSAPPWRDMGQWMEFPCVEMCRDPWIKTPHFWTWKLRLLAHIPLGRGTRVFIHGSLHISGHGNSIRWPISLQRGAPEFLSIDPCTFPDMETLSIGPYPSREGHWSFYPWTPAHFWTWKLRLLAHIPPGRGTRVFIHRPLHIYRHRNSVRWPVSLQGGAPEFLSMDPCTFPDMETPSIGPYPFGEGLWRIYL